MDTELKESFEVGDLVSLNVQETVTSDFLGALDLRLLKCLRYLPRRRSVWMADWQGRKVLLKIYVPHRKQERDVGREWRHSVALQEAGLEIPDPLFLAQGEDGVLAVGFDFIEGGETVDSVLETESLRGRQEIFTQLVDLHRRQHDAGWFQSDEHLGNYLWSAGKVWMLDAGSFESCPAPLAESERLANMSMLAANIPFPLMSEFDQAMASAYGDSLKGFDSAFKSAVLSRISKYYKKTRRACSEFECSQSGGHHWLACRDMNESLKEKLLSDPDQFFAGESLVKNGNTCSVVEVNEGGGAYVLKRYNQKSLMYRLTHIFLTPRAVLSWSNGHVLRLFGVSSPRPVACLLQKNGVLVRRGYLLMEKADGIPLWDEESSKMSEASQKIPTQFASLWKSLDTLDATHGDLKASNLMVDAAGVVTLIDLDSLTFHRSKREKQRSQIKDMRRFMRNWDKLPEVKAAFKKAVDERG